MNRDNLAAFKDYLAAKKAISKKYMDYYVRWVSSFYGFLDLPSSDVLPQDKNNNSSAILQRAMRHGR